MRSSSASRPSCTVNVNSWWMVPRNSATRRHQVRRAAQPHAERVQLVHPIVRVLRLLQVPAQRPHAGCAGLGVVRLGK
jgi:hypothetical protein